MPIDLVIEGVVAVLLALTVVYCFQLDRRLRALRSGQDGLRELIEALDRATDRAQAGMTQLSGAGQEATETLRRQVSEARVLADELAIMVESGNNLANRLEGGRARTGATASSEDSPAPMRADDIQSALDENPLLRALKEAR